MAGRRDRDAGQAAIAAHAAMAGEMAGACLAARARRLNRLVTRIYDEALRPYGITAAQLTVLVGIALAGPVQAAALGRELDLEKSTLSRALARLVAGTLVGQGRDLVLTAQGKRLLVRAFPAWQAAQEKVRQRLGHRAFPALEEMARGMRAC